MISELKDYFKKRNGAVLVFLFGSGVRGEVGPDSDIDIAVYFESEAKGRWSEEDREFPGEFQLATDVEKIVGHEVDLLVLNRAFPTVAESALRGIPLLIRDRRVYLNFLTRIVSEAIDFRGFVESWWNLKERRQREAATR